YTLTSTFAAILARVRILLTVDSNRAGSQDYLSRPVELPIDDFNGTAALCNKAVLDGAIDIQHYVDCYRGTHTTAYTPSDVTTEGNASMATMPAGARPYRFVYQQYVPALAEGVALTAGQYVKSNDRTYLVVTGGT